MDVDWIILADAAEAVNNKLYLVGGGWETLTLNAALPHVHTFAVAVAFSVPWTETNQQHNVQILIVDEDGSDLVNVSGQVEVARPPGVPHGDSQRVQMALNVALPLQRFGDYAIVARIESLEVRRVSFHVVAGSLPVGSQLSRT